MISGGGIDQWLQEVREALLPMLEKGRNQLKAPYESIKFSEEVRKQVREAVIGISSKYEFSQPLEPDLGVVFTHKYDGGRKLDVIYEGGGVYRFSWTIPYVEIEIDLSDSNIET